MAVRFVVEREYALDADAHFAAVMQFDELAEAMASQIRYEGLPAGAARAGQSMDLNLFLFGWLPIGRWHIDIVERDDAARRLVSREHGTMARRHDHVLTVEVLAGGGCRHRDEVTVDAGWRTGWYARTARRMYEKRHAARARLRS